MRDYQEFAAALRREIEGADLGRPEPDFRALDGARAPAALRWVPAAAVVLAVLGVGGYLGYDAWDGRRAVSEHNRLFVDSVFARGLFEAEEVPGLTLETPGSDSVFDSSETVPGQGEGDWTGR